MKTSPLKTLAAATALIFTAHSQAGVITVDGINTGNEYTNVYSLNYVIGGDNVEGKLSLARGSNADGVTGGSDDIFLLWEIPTEYQDLTFGENAAPGWGSKRDRAKYDSIQGSEYLGFDLEIFRDNKVETTEIKVKMKDAGSDGVGTGYEIDRNGDGALLAASTSLDHNIQLFGNQFIVDSPDCGSIIASDGSRTATSDADCYANHDAPGYEFAHIYEMQFDGSLFNFDDLVEFITKLSNSDGHASPPKNDNSIVNPTCIEDNNCTPVTEVPTPPVLPLLLTALAGIVLRRRIT